MLSFDDRSSDAGADRWIAQIGVTPAPVPRRGVRTALRFFAERMPTLPVEMALNFLRAMDLSLEVRALTLTPGEAVIAFRTDAEIASNPFRLFYARPGASKFELGINDTGRRAVRFHVRAAAPALESHTTGALDVWSIPANGQPLFRSPRANKVGYMASAGGVQLLIPNSASVLEAVDARGAPR